MKAEAKHCLMKLKTEPYSSQTQRWPRVGRVILAQFDEGTVVVYQAYRPEIGQFAAKHGYFGGAFSFSRMSWVKPNFLWMMYRCGWGSKRDQETTLAVRIKRSAFDEILRLAVPSSFDGSLFADKQAWQQAVETSEVRLQWDPDHDPSGSRLERRAIQLGLRGSMLERYANECVVEIEDISEFVAAQRANLAENGWPRLLTPREEPYPVTDPGTLQRLSMAPSNT